MRDISFSGSFCFICGDKNKENLDLVYIEEYDDYQILCSYCDNKLYKHFAN